MPLTETDILPFRQFIDSVDSAKHEHFATRLNIKANEAGFADMKKHVLKLYQGVEVLHSFTDENGSIFDCIPREHQPSLKGTSGDVAKPPDLPVPESHAGADERKPSSVNLQLSPDRKDQHGNVMFCPDGTIPMRRVTLEDLTRFETLHQFFQKSPFGSGHPRGIAKPAVAATHRWAHAYQNVNNLGGHSFINVWDPPIGANQVFSLSQHWYVGGSGAGLQTAEVGWQVYPGMYGNTKPVFFIYWTADDYQNTGCYNLTCSAFVQTNNSWTIGGTLSPWSVSGGAQYEIEVAYYLYQAIGGCM